MTCLSKRISQFSVLVLLAVLAAPLAASKAEAQQTPPNYDRYNSPLKAGQLTLQDVLNAHKVKKPITTPAAGIKSTTATSADIMLQEGMKSILQQPSTGKPVQLQAPSLKTVTPAAPTPLVPAAATVIGTATVSTPQPVDMPTGGVTYEPGEGPKNLAGEAPSVTSATISMPTSADMDEAPTPAPVKLTRSVTIEEGSTPGCKVRVENWTKACEDVGYPDNFTGKIVGETRTTCPDGALQDVWVANSCAPPGGEGYTAADVPAPMPALARTAAPVSAPAPTASASTPRVAAIPTSAQKDAGCGAANGLAASIAPAGDLCMSGIASEVSGDGPWRWNCKGANGGMTVSCAAPVTQTAAAAKSNDEGLRVAKTTSGGLAIEDGMCGSSDGLGTERAPSSNLCAKGAASRVSGSGPWTWACSGSNGGQAAACTASRKVDGICGASGRTGSDQMPMADLCTAGFASAVTGEGPWNWTCSGLYGGNPVTCSAAPKRDAVCGGASMSGHRDVPREGLCSVGDAGSVHGSGPWNWTCSGANGGATVTCNAASSVDGMCGSANGVAVTRAPSDELCSRGSPTRVVGTGPWDWNCAGSEGGNTQSCTAALLPRQTPAASVAPAPAVVPTPEPVSEVAETPAPQTTPFVAEKRAPKSNANLCGSAAQLMALEAPDKDLCTSGKASDVSGNGPWNWVCDDEGRTANCSTLSPTGSFGESSKKKSKSSAAVSPSPSIATAPAPVPAPVAAVEEKSSCGYSAGQGMSAAPVEGLCSVGKATPVKGVGPWRWTCVAGKAKTNCEAQRLQEGICGTANGSVQKFMPVKGLCSEGAPTQVQGTGPWLWSCIGSGGGASSSCSASAQAQTRIDGSCGAAANGAQTTAPDSNLCDSGVTSNVYGDGPWTWTCSGLNGGIAASCSASKDIPAAPPPPGPVVNGLCGASNGVAMVAEPVEDLCTSGMTTAVSGTGPWNWNCLGKNGGMTVSCTTPLQPPAPITGSCGSANGVPTLTMPRSGLCSAGISSAVSGKGPWTWSCSGTNGGGAVGCVGPVAGEGGGSGAALPSLSTPSSPSEAPVPMAAPTRPVLSSGLTTPRLEGKTSGSLKAPKPTAVPLSPAISDDMEAPPVPSISNDEPLIAPPVRDSLPPSPALKPTSIDSEGTPITGNRFKLNSDISKIDFNRNSENINNDETPTLDKLAAVMQANGTVRITLTAFADNSYGLSPRDARRLSLQRALAIRDYLTAKGISSARIDVRALGANMLKDQPLADKVDITAN